MTLLSLWITILKCFNPRFHLCCYDILCASSFFSGPRITRVHRPGRPPRVSSLEPAQGHGSDLGLSELNVL